MGLVTPWALLLAGALGLPVLIHLMRRRDLPNIPLPTVALLARADVRSRKRFRVGDPLLLALRLALVLCLVLAVCRPYVRATVRFGDGRIAALAVVLDDSMSMTRDAHGTAPLEEAVALAQEAISSLPQGSEVSIVLGGTPARVLVPQGTDLDLARKRLGDLAADSARGTDLPQALSLALRSLAGTRFAVKRLLVLTDAARHARLPEISWPERGVEAHVEVLKANGSALNYAIAEARAADDPTTGRVSIRILARAFGSSPGPVELRIHRQAKELAKTTLRFEAGVARAHLSVPTPAPRDSAGQDAAGQDAEVTAELMVEDALTQDNRRDLLLHNSASMRVLLVDGDPHPTRAQDEVGFLSRALDAAPTAPPYRTLDAEHLSPEQLGDADIVVLANVSVPSRSVVEALGGFVERGGGLLITGGDRVHPRAYADRFGALLPARFGAPSNADPPVTFRDAQGYPGLALARCRRRMLLSPTGPADTWLAFADGAPALLAGSRGQGRVALLALPLDRDFCDLPLRPGYLPLVSETLTRLASSQSLPKDAVATGSVVKLVPPAGGKRLFVLDPTGTEHPVPEDGRFKATDLPGTYHVTLGADQPRGAFVVAPTIAESDLTPGPLPQLAPEQQLEDSQVVRNDISPWLLLLAGLFALFEGAARLGRGVRWWRRGG